MLAYTGIIIFKNTTALITNGQQICFVTEKFANINYCGITIGYGNDIVKLNCTYMNNVLFGNLKKEYPLYPKIIYNKTFASGENGTLIELDLPTRWCDMKYNIENYKSLQENFENLSALVINEAITNQERIFNLSSVDYLRPFVEDFVNKIQTDWIYANLDEKLAVKSFVLYLARLKGLNIENLKFYKEDYIKLDILLGIIILKQKIIDTYIKSYMW